MNTILIRIQPNKLLDFSCESYFITLVMFCCIQIQRVVKIQ